MASYLSVSVRPHQQLGLLNIELANILTALGVLTTPVSGRKEAAPREAPPFRYIGMISFLLTPLRMYANSHLLTEAGSIVGVSS